MAEQLSDPIPNDVRQAFLEAIRLYKDWKFGGSEPLVSFRKLRQISISGLCELVLSYRNEPLPENIHKVLRSVIGGARPNLLDKDPSYAAGAQCLLKMIDVKRGGPQRRPNVRASWRSRAARAAVRLYRRVQLNHQINSQFATLLPFQDDFDRSDIRSRCRPSGKIHSSAAAASGTFSVVALVPSRCAWS